MQSRLLVLGLASKAMLPREAQHVLHRFMDAQSAGVMQRGAALVVLTAQQGLHAVVLKSKCKNVKLTTKNFKTSLMFNFKSSNNNTWVTSIVCVCPEMILGKLALNK